MLLPQSIGVLRPPAKDSNMTRIVATTLVLLMLPGLAQARTITVRGSECQRLVQQASTTSATYTPGVDVRGKAVAPADLDGGANLKLPEAIDIQIGVDLADRLGVLASKSKGGARDQAVRQAVPFEGKVPLGTITVKGQDVFWNGERLLPQDQVLLTEACRLSITTPGSATLPARKPEQ
jgi:hypothetical protein